MYKGNNIFILMLKGLAYALIFALAAVLIFALIIKQCNLPSGVIKPVNQFIKALAVFLGCFFGVRNDKGLIKGALLGFVIVIVTYLLFSFINGSFSFGISTIWEMLLGIAIGALSGMITVNITNKAV